MNSINDGAAKGKTESRRVVWAADEDGIEGWLPVGDWSVQGRKARGRTSNRDSGRVDPAQWAADQLAREDALRQLRAQRELGRLPDLTGLVNSMADEIFDEERPPKEWAVEGLARKNHIVSLPSSRKTGKSTFLANLGFAGINAEKFLGEFATYLPEDKYVVAVNAEMTSEDYNEIWDSLQPRDTEYEDSPLYRVVPLHCREHGIRLDFLNEPLAEWFTERLIEAEAGWLFLDPWKNFLAWAGVGMNDNDGVNRLFTRIQQIHSDAGLGLTVIAMHTAQNASEDDEGRAKGAGELEDGIDSMWRYVREGEQRFLSVRGRGGVGLGSREILFHPANGRLSIGTERPEARRDALATIAEDALALAPEQRLNRTELEMAIGGHRNKIVKAINAALAGGRIVKTKEGREVIYTLPDVVKHTVPDVVPKYRRGTDPVPGRRA